MVESILQTEHSGRLLIIGFDLMWYFIRCAQYIFCLVSMVLTSLFVLSLTGISFASISAMDSIEKLLMTILFLLIGCCIDIGKYLFWSQRHVTHYFFALSITLMVFSWLASCAFLITSESDLLERSRLNSPEYLSQQQRIHGVERQIAQQERLLAKRLESSFHSQWEAGQEVIDSIAELRKQLFSLRGMLPLTGQDSADETVPTARFFSDVGQLLDLKVYLVRAGGFGLLSLLLELSTLGMISLAQAYSGLPDSNTNTEPNMAIDSNEGSDAEARQAVARLSADILQGEIPPVIRKIRAASYGLDIDQIRQALKNLWEAGLLETDKRNSYQLPVNGNSG